jgi:predicted amidohydrolase YtcJ
MDVRSWLFAAESLWCVMSGAGQKLTFAHGPSTQVIDLAGRTVIPGVIDTHIHVIDPGTTDSH